MVIQSICPNAIPSAIHARAHPGRPCDSFDQLAKKLVTRLAAPLERTPGNGCLAWDGLPLRSTRGQYRIPRIALRGAREVAGHVSEP